MFINFPQENIQKWWIWKLLKITSLNPDVHFILVISTLISKKRSIEKNEPFPDSIETLTKRLESYIEYAGANRKAHFIWCEQSIEIIEKDIYIKLKENKI